MIHGITAGFTRNPPIPPASFLLNEYPGAHAAFSVRKLRSEYSGPCMRVVKEGVGSPEQDIGFTSSGDIDLAAIEAFKGSANLRIHTWYDQSGNGKNLTTNEFYRPLLANAGEDVLKLNGKLAAYFSSSSAFETPGVIQSLSAFCVANISGTDTNYRVVVGDTNGLGPSLEVKADGAGKSIARFMRTNAAQLVSVPYVDAGKAMGVGFTSEVGACSVYLGSQHETAAVNPDFSKGIGFVGGLGSGTLSLNDKIQEVIIYASNQSSNRIGIYANQAEYFQL